MFQGDFKLFQMKSHLARKTLQLRSMTIASARHDHATAGSFGQKEAAQARTSVFQRNAWKDYSNLSIHATALIDAPIDSS
jgi:hypothetical protein